MKENFTFLTRGYPFRSHKKLEKNLQTAVKDPAQPKAEMGLLSKRIRAYTPHS